MFPPAGRPYFKRAGNTPLLPGAPNFLTELSKAEGRGLDGAQPAHLGPGLSEPLGTALGSQPPPPTRGHWSQATLPGPPFSPQEGGQGVRGPQLGPSSWPPPGGSWGPGTHRGGQGPGNTPPPDRPGSCLGGGLGGPPSRDSHAHARPGAPRHRAFLPAGSQQALRGPCLEKGAAPGPRGSVVETNPQPAGLRGSLELQVTGPAPGPPAPAGLRG